MKKESKTNPSEERSESEEKKKASCGFHCDPSDQDAEQFTDFIATKSAKGVTSAQMISGYSDPATGERIYNCEPTIRCSIRALLTKAHDLGHAFIIKEFYEDDKRFFKFFYDFEKGKPEMAVKKNTKAKVKDMQKKNRARAKAAAKPKAEKKTKAPKPAREDGKYKRSEIGDFDLKAASTSALAKSIKDDIEFRMANSSRQYIIHMSKKNAEMIIKIVAELASRAK